jgi:hypothetical protein
MSTTSTEFDLGRFCSAVEGRDVDGQIEFYAPAATVTIVDRITGPGSPRILRGRDEIKSWVEDVAGRDMTHSVKHSVKDDRGAAFYEACRYPDGTNVICATVLELDGGSIVSQTVVQAWDES